MECPTSVSHPGLGLILRLNSSFFFFKIYKNVDLILGKTEGKRRRGRQRMKWGDSITDSMDMNLRKLREILKDRKAWCTAVQEVAKSQIRLSD